MAKIVYLLLFVMIAATVVNCSKVTHDQERVREARLQKELKAQADIVGSGLTGRLASAYPGPAVASRRIPSVHAHVGGHKPCHQGEAC